MDELAVYYFHQGTSAKAYELLGAHLQKNGTRFCVWAPNALEVSVIGDFNYWDVCANKMHKITNEGLFEVFVENAKEFDCYQYAIRTQDKKLIYKSDPYAFHSELRPQRASKIYNLDSFKFTDDEWMKNRSSVQRYDKPLNIYELHFGSWRKYRDGNFFNYAQIAKELCEYVKSHGFTHIEILPLSEYPYDPSWGYQVTGFYSVTARYGTPEDFMKFVNTCHEYGIGVIMDWVPGHFNKDAHGLVEFDGGYVYEPSNPKKMENVGWGTRCFDFGRCEVQSFLVSNAMFWVEKFHIDGLRVDAVSSMLYLDYCRQDGEWEKNCLGTNINLEALAFIKKVNKTIKAYDGSLLMIAEESTAFPKITAPINYDGLGFDYKWNMGWMNDVLKFMGIDPLFRGDHLNLINFQLTYCFSEHYILPISHDEVVHLKKSLISKMPGSYEQKFASTRLFFTYMFTHPGKKLNFMGNEFGQFNEWNESVELDWSSLQYETHRNLQKYFKDLSSLYITMKALYDESTNYESFEWLVVDDNEHCVFAYKRKSNDCDVIVILNFAYIDHLQYKINVEEGLYTVILNSDEQIYGGSSLSMNKTLKATKDGLILDLVSNSGIILRKEK